MAKQLLNEAEQFLITNWTESRLLEESMEAVRTKYKELFQRVIESVTQLHPELDANGSYPTQFWGSGSIGFGKKSWPDGNTGWPAGLWMWNLRLELLTTEDSKTPIASIWVPKKTKLDLKTARSIVDNEAKKLLSAEELKDSAIPQTGEELRWFSAPSKNDLLKSLSDDDGSAFVNLLVKQISLMARFVPTLDKIFLSPIG